jgi:site-specific recombinase XerD
MAHHKAKYPRQPSQIMVVDHSPRPVSQSRTATPLDPSPLQKYIKEYLTNCIIEEKAPDTLDTYAFRLNDFMKGTTGFSPAELRVYFKSLIDRGLAASTRNAYYRSIHTFLTWVKTEEHLEYHPMDNIKPPRMPRTLPQPFPPEDIEKLLIITSGQRYLDARNRAMVLVFLDTGLRLAELSALLTSSIDLITGRALVMGKGSKERIVRVGKTARKAVNHYLSMRQDDLPQLWLSEERRPMTKDGIKCTMKKLCIRAGVKGAAHKLRHTFALNYLRNGGELAILQLNMGHSDIKTTKIYLNGLNGDDVIREHQKVSPVDNMGIK